MQDNDGVSQSDDSSDEDREEKRPVKKRKKNLPIVESDTEDSELESVNEMDSKKQNSDTENKKRPAIINDKKLSGNIIQPSTVLVGISANTTTTRSVTLAGKLDAGGSCSGEGYSDPYDAWSSVVVQAVVSISVSDYNATVNLKTDRVYLRSGITCKIADGNCLDLEGGYTFWDSLPGGDCRFNRYDVLYEGLGSKISVAEDHRAQVV